MKFTPVELADHTEDPKTQEVLFSFVFDTMTQMIDAPILYPETKQRLVTELAEYFIGKYVKGFPPVPKPKAPISGGIHVDLESLAKMEAAPTTPVKPVVAKSDAHVTEFNNLMKVIVNQNKGRKTLIGKSNIEKLVSVIDSYTGSVKVMNKIKAEMNKTGSETFVDKVAVVSEFVKSITLIA